MAEGGRTAEKEKEAFCRRIDFGLGVWYNNNMADSENLNMFFGLK